MTPRNFLKDGDASTHKTISLLRETDKTIDVINDMGNPPSILAKVIRTVNRELLYGAAISWKLTAVLAIYFVAAMLVLWILF